MPYTNIRNNFMQGGFGDMKKYDPALRILLARTEARIPQWTLALSIGISSEKLSKLERGRKPLSTEMKEKILAAIEKLSRHGGEGGSGA